MPSRQQHTEKFNDITKPSNFHVCVYLMTSQHFLLQPMNLAEAPAVVITHEPGRGCSSGFNL
eukprot:scaffold61116_cov22-Tisochrysis_lutea.AAC.1